jgi:hypothetical protein
VTARFGSSVVAVLGGAGLLCALVLAFSGFRMDAPPGPGPGFGVVQLLVGVVPLYTPLSSSHHDDFLNGDRDGFKQGVADGHRDGRQQCRRPFRPFNEKRAKQGAYTRGFVVGYAKGSASSRTSGNTTWGGCSPGRSRRPHA